MFMFCQAKAHWGEWGMDRLSHHMPGYHTHSATYNGLHARRAQRQHKGILQRKY